MKDYEFMYMIDSDWDGPTSTYPKKTACPDERDDMELVMCGETMEHTLAKTPDTLITIASPFSCLYLFRFVSLFAIVDNRPRKVVHCVIATFYFLLGLD